MTTFAESLRPALSKCRGIGGSLGLRTHAVTVLHGTWSGTHTGDGTETLTLYPILEDGQNPKVHWFSDERAALADQTTGAKMEIGPLTPAHMIGGTELATLTGGALSTGQTLYVRIVGPTHPAPGARYLVVGVRAESALHYTLQCKPA
jgi:hypothetical protein